VGLARELACLLDRDLKLPAAKVKAGAAKVKELIKVELKDKELCPRYAGRSVLNVKIGPSPDWLSKRLKSVGLNSINNVVDVTNFVMMEYGQPLHAFDADELQGAKLSIEKSKPKEKFKTFDGTEYELIGEELTIRDGARAVALAGVIGGLNSGVTNKTTNIFLEAAHFNPRGVRRSARRLGITTDSSHRFSRGTDPENVVEAMNRAVQLIQEVAGGEASKDHYDLYPSPQVREPILVRHKTLEERLGYPVDMADFASWMKRLQCKVSPASGKKSTTAKSKAAKDVGGDCLIEAPTFRWDIEIEMDLVEEYARLNGYDKIPEIFPKVEAQPTDSVPAYYHELRLAQLLIAEGFLEARNYNFVSPKWQAGIVQPAVWTQLGLPTGGEAVMVKNPLSEETSQMRQSLLPGLLTNLVYNYSHGSAHGALFESGMIFGKKEDQYQESQRLAGVLWGQPLNLWDKTAVPAVIDLKSRLESLVRRLRGQLQLRDLKPEQVPAILHPGQVAGLFYEGRMIGVVGALHPEFREEHKIRSDAAVFELDFDALMRGQPRSAKSQKISRLPAVDRDLALLMPTKIHVGDVVREIEKAGAPLLQSVLVFDVFKGTGIPEGQHSVTFRMVFQDMENTLSDERLAQAMAQILTGIQKKYPEAMPRS
jgi:phenylalanyl-tRNA synthetase beta chain